MYTELALGEKWPKGTQVAELSEWIFTCKVQTPDLPIYSACNFAYLDYAGGLLTDEQEDSNIGIELEEKIKDADALIGLLDGQRLCELIRGESSGVRWSINDLTNILDIMQTSEKPIHFIVSKWDVVEGNYSLEEIKKRLLEIEEFRNVVETRNQAGTPVRLIPVSSVGMGFAVLQPDGRMEKKVEILPQPYQIEMPLACILPDMIKVKLEELMKTREQEERQIVKVQANLSFWDKLTKFIGGTSKAIIESVQELLPKKYQFATDLIGDFIGFIDDLEKPIHEKEAAAKRREEELKRKKEESINAVKSEETALRHVVNCFFSIVNQLEKEYPSSNIKL